MLIRSLFSRWRPTPGRIGGKTLPIVGKNIGATAARGFAAAASTNWDDVQRTNAAYDPVGPNRFRRPLLTKEKGANVIKNGFWNKGTAYTSAERHSLRIRGLVPPTVKTLEGACVRV